MPPKRNDCGVSARRVRSFLEEPIHTPDFAARLQEANDIFRDLRIQSADLYAKKVLLQYMAIRAFRPETVVETGVANGVSSAYILLALQKNERGALHSVSLKDPSTFQSENRSAGSCRNRRDPD